MGNKTLSAFPYYGGKAKMSTVICSLLEYDTTRIYVEPYGGGCRTLLNKRPHEQEIYNDFSYGLSAFFKIMTDMDKTEELIMHLLEYPPEKERFEAFVIKRMEVEDQLNTADNARLSAIALSSYRAHGISTFQQLKNAVGKKDYKGVIKFLDDILNNSYIISQMDAIEEQRYIYYYRRYKDYWGLVSDIYEEAALEAGCAFEYEWEQHFDKAKKQDPLYKVYRKGKQDFIHEVATARVEECTSDTLNCNELGTEIPEMELAFMIFQLYYSSRDGIGAVWSDEKNRNINNYNKAVANLRNVAERMCGVAVTQADALDLVRIYRKNAGAMIYLDPSYLKPENEKTDLGKGIYKMSYGYSDHERLLKEITKDDTAAKILISNYDIELYNEYLCQWEKINYETSTSVGAKKGRSAGRRTEVLWKNY